MVIRFVTDSTSNIKARVAESLQIKVVPNYIFFGQEEFREGGNLSFSEFIDKLTSCKETPQTAPPSSAEFVRVYEDLIREGVDTILSIHASSRLSNIYRNACIARETISRSHPNVKVVVIDSQLVDLALGACVEEAVKLLQAGKSVEEIIEFVEKTCRATRAYLCVDTLEYLKRGGRVTRLAAFFGSMLDVKPILKLENGQIELVEKASGREKALEALFQILKKEIPPGSRLDVGVGDALCQPEGDQFLQRVSSAFRCEVKRRASIAPSVAIHTGPGTIAIAYRIL